MKVATFNINNINRRLPNLLQWLSAAKPDVVCLQELKATDDFPADQLAMTDTAAWKGQKSWNGVAYKLEWFKRLAAHGKALLAEGVPVILAGDYNVADEQEELTWGDPVPRKTPCDL